VVGSVSSCPAGVVQGGCFNASYESAATNDFYRLPGGHPVETSPGAGSQFVKPDPPADLRCYGFGRTLRDRSRPPVADRHDPGHQLAVADDFDRLAGTNPIEITQRVTPELA
jgi:hypothetical protein